jgi:cytochrome c peroxidase
MSKNTLHVPLRSRFLLLTGLLACGTTETIEPTPVELGEQLFSQALPNSKGRSCASCHVPEDNFTLTPDHVAKLPPNDPLFSAIDADDPTADPLTFEHLKKGSSASGCRCPTTST